MSKVVCIIPIDKEFDRLLSLKSSDQKILYPFKTTLQDLDEDNIALGIFEQLHGIKPKAIMHNIVRDIQTADDGLYHISLLLVEIDGQQADSVVQNSQDLMWVDHALYTSCSQQIHEILRMFCDIWFNNSNNRNTKVDQAVAGHGHTVRVIPINSASKRLLAVTDARGKVSPICVAFQGSSDRKTAKEAFERLYNIPIRSVINYRALKVFEYKHSGTGEPEFSMRLLMVAEVDECDVDRLIADNKDMVWVDNELYSSMSASFEETLRNFCERWFSSMHSGSEACSGSSAVRKMKLC